MRDRDKTVLALLDEGLTYSDIGARLGISKGAVSGIVTRSGVEPKSRAYDHRLLRACEYIDAGKRDEEVSQLARVRLSTVADLRKELGALDGV